MFLLMKDIKIVPFWDWLLCNNVFYALENGNTHLTYFVASLS
jgi:hypothetical protein